jgi:lipid-A-disaccharide synthase
MTPDVYDLMAAADVVLTKTGTTTVECAILGTPMVAAYRTGTVNYAIARALVDVAYIAMPNLIAKRRIVPELVQSAATPAALAREAVLLLTDDAVRQAQVDGLAVVREKLGPPGAVQRAADAVEQWLAVDG